MPDWSRPRRVHNMRKVLRQHGQKPPKGCDFWVLNAVLLLSGLLAAIVLMAWRRGVMI